MRITRRAISPIFVLLVTGITALATAAVLAAVPPQPRAGERLADLTWGQSQRFIDGRQAYITPLTPVQGLGPAFNRHSCVDCHETPIGGWSAIKVTHFGLESPGGFDFLEHLGGPVLQADAIGDDCRELVPAVANHVRERVTPSVLAFGLVEAIPDAALLALADPNDANGDGISGRAHMVQPLESPTGPQRVGRFGWKAQIATVRSFSGDAARNEMGLTNLVVTEETAPNGDESQLAECDSIPDIEDRSINGAATFVDRVTDFQRYLAPPPQSPRGGMTGETIFTQIGCAKCHTPSFVTGTDPAIEPALRGRTIRPYSDFLLHDMGALADGIPDGQALPNEMKTPPLWNLHTRPVLLHDGSVFQGDFATKVTAAILAHAGEATISRNAFQALPAASKTQVLAFLDSLGRNDFDADGDGLLTGADLSSAIANSNDLDVSPDEPWAVADLDQDRRIEADEIAQLQQLLGVPADCNQDGVADASQISTGVVTDADQNGQPDECDQSSCTGLAIRRQGTGGAIPDNNPSNALISSITIPVLEGGPTVREIRVVLDINHTWLSDLEITLQRGTDAPITLHSACGGANDAIGVYRFVDSAWEGAPSPLQRMCDGPTIDQGGSDPETRFRMTPGTYKPNQGSGFLGARGKTIAATWRLKIADLRPQDAGTLNSWALEIRYADPMPPDCDSDGTPDCFQIPKLQSADCDQDGLLDACQSMSSDCDGDGQRDRCQIHDGTALDCNANGLLDQCDLAANPSIDCNGNGMPDECDIADGEPDQNNNGTLDACEDQSPDFNSDGNVNGLDLGVLLSSWGSNGLGDLNGDGIVGGADLSILLSSWTGTTGNQPTLSSVSPTSGPSVGGTLITLTGTNLSSLSSVRVGGTSATGVEVVNSTTVRAVTPAGVVGTQAVSVSTPTGTASLSNGFSYVASPPTLTSVSPASGPASGATLITLTGTNLLGTTSVTVGGVAAANVQVVNATTVTAITPAGALGAKSVGVTTASGTATLANGFTYATIVTPPWATLIEAQPDPAVVTLPSLRAAIAATGLAWRVRDTATQIEMMLIPPGTFEMGCSASDAFGCSEDENPVHSVTLTNAFYMGRYEVTQAQWQARMGSNPSYFQRASPQVPASQVSNRPVEQVSWNTIQGFLTQSGMRLPTEAEWEYAYRAATTTAFHGATGIASGTNDDNQLGTIAWYSANATSQTRPVGGKLGNGFGLHDMAGNVWEWVSDFYGSTYFSSSPQSNPTGPTTGPFRVVRGAGFGSSTNSARSSFRNYFEAPTLTANYLGFRVVRTPSISLPTLSAVSPPTGPAAGSTLITLTGTNLSGATGVSVGGVAATNVEVVNATTVTAVTPAGTAGAQTVSVTTPGGTATLSAAFTYVATVVPSWATLIEASPDPTVVTSPNLRSAITATNLAWRVRDVLTQIEFVLIPPGTFEMGCSASNVNGCSSDESPVHTVTLTNAFYMGRYEVTQAQWQARMGSNPSFFQSASAQVPAVQVPNRPVEKVSWNGIQGFLNQTGMRLPTEAEWEYAYRAGTATAFHGFASNLSGTNDDSLLGNIAWFSASSIDQTRPVGGKMANGYGLHDMAGNVWEWVSDYYGSTYYSSSPQNNPAGPSTGMYRVVRGAGFGSSANSARASFRNYYETPTLTANYIGFRVVRNPETPAPTLLAVAPSAGPTSGGTVMTLTGTNLSGATSVTVGGVAATSLQVVNATTVTAVTPAGEVGLKSVSVTTAGGTATLSSVFTYAAAVVPSWATLIEALPDPSVVTSASIRNAIAASGYAWRVRDTATQIELMLIPAGTFQMGCSPSSQEPYGCGSDESPVHTVTLTNAFYMGRYEVTQAQWQARMGSNPSFFQTASAQVPVAQVPNRPVEKVSWNGIQGFLSQTGMRLPTEAEWEYAYRAGTTTAFHGYLGNLSGTSDESMLGNIAWYGANAVDQPRPVGSKLANGYGLHDMAGNVWEWVSDYYGSTYFSSSPQNNPTGPTTGTYRVVRGAGFGSSTNSARASFRNYYETPTLAANYIGFRVVKNPQTPAPTLTTVAPATGPVSGGTLITLTGTNLSGATSVAVGGVAATSVQVVNATTVTALTPAGSAGAKSISITTPGGTSTAVSAFTYVATAVPAWATLIEALPDPAVVTSSSVRAAIAATGWAWRVRDAATQIEFVLIPPGSFQMGCSASSGAACSSDESPVHSVTLTNAFYMGRYEVTQAQWQARMGSNPSFFQGGSYQVPSALVPNRPVERVSWNGVQGFLSQTGMRLPTEAEWEYAYRAGTTTAFHGYTGSLNGTNESSALGNIAWYGPNAIDQTRPVGGKLANGYGLHDMAGNVWEWVSDYYGSTYYSNSPQNNPLGPTTGTYRVVRGAGFGSSANSARASFRNYFESPALTANYIGFRVVRSP